MFRAAEAQRRRLRAVLLRRAAGLDGSLSQPVCLAAVRVPRLGKACPRFRSLICTRAGGGGVLNNYLLASSLARHSSQSLVPCAAIARAQSTVDTNVLHCALCIVHCAQRAALHRSVHGLTVTVTRPPDRRAASPPRAAPTNAASWPPAPFRSAWHSPAALLNVRGRRQS